VRARPHARIAARCAALLAAGLGASGCAVDARTGLAMGQPLAPPGRAATPYTAALECLDGQMARQPRARDALAIAAGTIPDATGRLSPGLRDMVTAAFVRANRLSRALVPTEALTLSQVPVQNTGSVTAGTGTIIAAGDAPSGRNMLQVHGSLSQADRAVQGQTMQAGIGFGENMFGISQNSDIANVGIDLHLTVADTRQILYSVSNAMTVRNRSRGANADFSIRNVGVNLEIAFDEREGLHQAVRTLVELSVLELIGQWAQVPYWHCLQTDRANPAVMRQIAAWYRALGPGELDAWMRRHLAAIGYVVPPAPASATPAIGAFQQDHGLVPNGQPTFETFAALMDARLDRTPGATGAVAAAVVPPPMPPPEPAGPIGLRLAVVETGIAEPLLQLTVEPDRVAWLACWYRDEEGGVWRILPSRHQPEPQAGPTPPLRIPPAVGARPVIQPTRPAPGLGFLCAARERDWAGGVPARFWGNDLTRLPGVDFESLGAALRAAGGTVTETSRGGLHARWIRLEGAR
jgi:curli biogenesis system outer membrane secretion channel CsgG